MGSAEICWPDSSEKKNCRKRPWTSQEDMVLLRFVSVYGEGRWDAIAKASGLKRKGKSCRLRWFNYLRPDLNRTRITADEEQVIKDLHERWGNRWSLIARYLPGRTDNQIKNYFRNHIKKKKSMKNSVDKEIQPSDSSTETQNNCNIYDYLDETQPTTGKLGNVIESDLSETNVLGFNEDGRPPVDTISCSTDALYASDRELFVDHYCDDQLWKYNQSEVFHTIEHNYENTDKLFL